MCDAFLMLAQHRGGLSCFLCRAGCPTARATAFHIQRLKDKLGNRSNASSEIEFDGAWARMVGEEGRGVRDDHRDGQPHAARLRDRLAAGDAPGGRAGDAPRRAPRARSASGSIDQPLMQNVLADLCVESEAATRGACCGWRAPTTDGAGDEHERRFARLATAVVKYWVCKRAPAHVAEALECLGGNGYVEESILPRLYREAPLNGIWEGSGNVICLDVLRAMGREPGPLDAFFDEVALAAAPTRGSTRSSRRCAAS